MDDRRSQIFNLFTCAHILKKDFSLFSEFCCGQKNFLVDFWDCFCATDSLLLLLDFLSFSISIQNLLMKEKWKQKPSKKPSLISAKLFTQYEILLNTTERVRNYFCLSCFGYFFTRSLSQWYLMNRRNSRVFRREMYRWTTLETMIKLKRFSSQS